MDSVTDKFNGLDPVCRYAGGAALEAEPTAKEISDGAYEGRGAVRCHEPGRCEAA